MPIVVSHTKLIKIHYTKGHLEKPRTSQPPLIFVYSKTIAHFIQRSQGKKEQV